MVLIPKKTRRQILEHLFKEGVMVVKKDYQACKHNELEDIPNLHVMMVLRSLASRHYLQEIYSWRWHYYTLTNEGIEYLREVLHLPAQVFPQTLTKQRPTRPALAGGESEGGCIGVEVASLTEWVSNCCWAGLLDGNTAHGASALSFADSSQGRLTLLLWQRWSQ